MIRLGIGRVSSGRLATRLLAAFVGSVAVQVGVIDVAPASDSTSFVLQPRIVNGHATAAYPTTGALLFYDDAAATNLAGSCSGTLIGCRTFLTAAHCVCPDDTDAAAGCEREGHTDPATMRVFLQQGGVFPVVGTVISPDYRFAESGDVAIVTLAEPVTGIAPSAINMARRADLGATGTIVGFGTTASGRRSTDDSGIKREGMVTTAQCAADITDAAHLCWSFLGGGSNSCDGDSGGPLFIDFGDGPVVAGVTSGGHSFDCLAPDTGFDSDTFVNRSWIIAAAGTDLGTASCGLPAVGTASTTEFTTVGQLDSTAPEARLQLEVPAAATVLRIAMNGQFASTSGFYPNDYDLFVRAGSAPTVDRFDCADTNATTFGFCQINSPEPGTWHVMVRLNQGAGAFQVTATTFAPPQCAGDCDGDGGVSGNELLTGLTLALGTHAASCPSCDANGDGVVSVGELIKAVDVARTGCPAG